MAPSIDNSLMLFNVCFMHGFSFPAENYFETRDTHQGLSNSGQGILGNEVPAIQNRTEQEQRM